MMMKSNYKNTQNKWQEDYAKWFIELKKIKKNSFQEISKDFIKNDFELLILIYLFTKNKFQFIFNWWFVSISFVFNFQKKLFVFIV